MNDTTDEIGFGVLAAPLPQVSFTDINQFTKDIYAKGPYSFYIKAKVHQDYATVKKYRNEVDEDQVTALFAREVRALR